MMKMPLLNKGVTMLHFDETYYLQKALSRYAHENIDFFRLQEANLYCGQRTFQTISARLRERKRKGITFIGSGNYHYVSYILLQEIDHPFTLVLFDNHTDLAVEQQEKALLSCGSWVSFALASIPNLKDVIIIGPTSVQSHQKQISRVAIYPFDGKHSHSLKSIISSIDTDYIYISIDKDVLNIFEVETNWDQGAMDLETLIQYLQSLLRTKNVAGVDICGETKITPHTYLLPDSQRTIKKNEQANLKILQECLTA